MNIRFLLAVIAIAGLVCAQEPGEVVKAVAKSFCRGAADNSRCNIPAPYNGEMDGVCCGGQCMFEQSKCSPNMNMIPPYDVYGIFQRYSCKERKDGEACDIPAAISRELDYKLKGTCCSKVCRIGIESCRNYCGDRVCTSQERSEGNCQEDCGRGGSWDVCGDGICSESEGKGGKCTEDCGSGYEGSMNSGGPAGMSMEEQMESMRFISCLGAEDGSKCNLPNELEREFGLTGVCCSEKCSYRKTECEKEAAPKANERPDLIVSSINVSPENPTGDERVNVTVAVSNAGKAPAENNFWITLKIEDGGFLLTDENFEVRETLEAGESVEHTFTDKLGLGRTGSFRVRAEADANSNFEHQSNLINESDESNNGGSKTLYVASAAKTDIKADYCGDGLCTEQEGKGGNCMEDCGRVENGKEPDEPRPATYLILAAAIIGVAVVAFIIVLLIRSKKKVTLEDEKPKTVEELQQQKDEIENMMSIAKAKYHRRELDEESFREIIRDNQKKVIELELKIKTYRP